MAGALTDPGSARDAETEAAVPAAGVTETGHRPDPAEAEAIARDRRELVLLRARVARLERDVASMQPLIRCARDLTPWDFTPYDVRPGGDYVAVDRDRIEHLLAALASIDHWVPWRTPIEPRPQP